MDTNNRLEKVRISLAQIDVRTGRPDINFERIVGAIDEAKKKGAEIVVFPEMVIPGYLIGDMWEDEAFVKDCSACTEEVRRRSKGIAVIFGNVLVDDRLSLFSKGRTSFGNDGRVKKYNAAFIVKDGKFLEYTRLFPLYKNRQIFPSHGVTVKTNEPLYREFEDQRHFLPLKEYAQQLGFPLSELLQPFKLEVRGKVINVGVLICEDIWTGDYIYSGEVLDPSKILVDNGAELLITISSSPYGWRKNNARSKNVHVVQERLFKRGKPRTVVYLNHVGLQNNGKTEFVFDGRSAVFTGDGSVIFEAPAFKEGIFTLDVPVSASKKSFGFVDPVLTKKEQRLELKQALVYGIRKFFEERGLERAVIGLSGGIDSSLVAFLCAEALGREKVLGVNMPTRFNSEWTKSTALHVAGKLGIAYQIVPIEDMANLMREKLLKVEFNGAFGKYGLGERDRTVDENMQARIRSADILAGISAKYERSVYTSNGNKTEILLGWFTLDGDGRGALCPIGDIYKTQVIDLAAQINEDYLVFHNGEVVFPWELISPLFDPERYFDNWDGEKTLIPPGTDTLVPSAELSEKQDVYKKLGDPIIYPYHDFLLREFVEYRRNPEDILRSFVERGFEGLGERLGMTAQKAEKIVKENFSTPGDFISDLERVWRLYHLAIFKQIQSPPILAVSKRALGFDFRRAQTDSYLTKEYFLIKERILRGDGWGIERH